MPAEDVIFLYQLFTSATIAVWIIGGWGIDALLGEQTRMHKDLDVLVLMDDVARLLALLEGQNYSLAYLWEENRFMPDRQEKEIATAFVWRDGGGHEIDVHAMRLDDDGNGVPMWIVDEALLFRRQDLEAQGVIGDVRVRCISPQMQLAYHTGYELPESHLRDMERIRAKFGIT